MERREAILLPCEVPALFLPVSLPFARVSPRRNPNPKVLDVSEKRPGRWGRCLPADSMLLPREDKENECLEYARPSPEARLLLQDLLLSWLRPV